VAAAGPAAGLERARDRGGRGAQPVAILTAPVPRRQKTKNWIARGSRAIVEG
jgi:hypothetical protein